MCFNRCDESDYDPNESSPRPYRGYSPFESVYKIDPKKGSMKKYIEEEMVRFDCNFDIESGKMKEKNIKAKTPSFETIFERIKEWTKRAKMESEIPIMALVYIERFMKKTGILINENNWERIVMVTLCVASKIWDDDSLENENFAQVFPDFSLKEISMIENKFLSLIEYEVMITSKQFTKYAFILSTFCNGEIPDYETPKKQKSLKKLQFESERMQNKHRKFNFAA